VPIRFPTERHRLALDDVLAELHADPNVLGVMVGGSLARGTARDDSDIDVMAVVKDQKATRSGRKYYGTILVEQGARTPEEWARHFSPARISDESWGYAFLDGVIVHDPHGAVAGLVTRATEAHATYRVPDAIKAHYAWHWSHALPKLRAVLHKQDPVEIGWAAAVMTNSVIETIWAINGRPLPSRDLGCLQRNLDELTTPARAADRIRDILRAAPEDALRLQLQLLDEAVPYLPEPGVDEP